MTELEPKPQKTTGEKDRQFITECKNCARYFDTRRRCVGDPFRCASCGQKHDIEEVSERHPSGLLLRVKWLLKQETGEDVQKKIQQLNLEPGRDTDAEYLYIMEKGDGMVKIGISKDPQDRLYSVQTANSESVRLRSKFDIKNPRTVEKELHRRFSDQQLSGEWFELNPETVRELDAELEKRTGGGVDELADGSAGTQITLSALE